MMMMMMIVTMMMMIVTMMMRMMMMMMMMMIMTMLELAPLRDQLAIRLIEVKRPNSVPWTRYVKKPLNAR